MNNSRYADIPPTEPAQSTTEQTSTIPTQKPINQTSSPPFFADPTSTYTYPDYDADTMDEFAQTRAPDDLFDDDFTPISEPTPQAHIPTGPRDRGQAPQRGHGERGSKVRGGRRVGVPEEEHAKAGDGQDEVGLVKEAPREHAVRGDRSGTGGVKKPKLTEDELSARLEKLAIKNAAREAAHKRAEADEASFQQREQVAQAKRREERQNRQVLEGEREKNRLRKLKAVQGREWDAEKKEDDFNSGRGSGGNSSHFRRGAYGGVGSLNDGYAARGGNMAMDEGSEFFNSRGDSYHRGSRGRGRGRGDGFRGRGGGRGRGGQYNGPPNEQPRRNQNSRNPDISAENDFPALPGTSSAQGGDEGQKPKTDPALSTETEHKKKTPEREFAPGVGSGNKNWTAETDGDTWATDQTSGGKDATWADQMITPVTPSAGW